MRFDPVKLNTREQQLFELAAVGSDPSVGLLQFIE